MGRDIILFSIHSWWTEGELQVGELENRETLLPEDFRYSTCHRGEEVTGAQNGWRGWRWVAKGDRVEITRVVITRCHGDKVLADEVAPTLGLSSIPIPHRARRVPLSNVKERRPTSSLILFTENLGWLRSRIFYPTSIPLFIIFPKLFSKGIIKKKK